MYLSDRMVGLGLLVLVCLVAFAFGLSGCAVADETPDRSSEVDDLPPYTQSDREFELTASPGDICPNGIKFTTWCGCLPPLVGSDC